MADKQELRIVSAVADKKQAVLYLEDGNQIILKQGDHRLGDLLDIIIPIMARGETAVVSLDGFSIYAAFEKKTTGLTRFFKVAKDKVKGFFGGQTDTHKAVIPEEGKAAIIAAVMGESMTEAEVIEHGEPVNLTDDVGPEEVVVAVVTTPARPATASTPAVAETKKVIPGVQNLKPLIDHAVRTNSAQSVQNFLTRCAAFIDKRQHSVDDLMRFLEKGDLPLAEDGSIIAYKMLNWMDQSKGIMKDCHSGKIPQKIGSYVCVNEDLVDLNRRTECSNGLHIARRGYLSGFSGEVCVICKIDPEDVMVVPHNDANKVRVKGYHILGYLSDEAKSALKQGKPATGDNEALKLIHDAIKGVHVDRLERVQVNGQMGSNVVVTKIKDAVEREAPVDVTGADLERAKALDSEDRATGAVDVREINKRVTEVMNLPHSELNPDAGVTGMAGKVILTNGLDPAPARAEGMEPKPEPAKSASPVDDLLLDYNTAPEGAAKNSAAQALVAFKKSKKKGWDKLGIDDNLASQIIRDAAAGPGEPAPAKAKAPEPAPVTKPKAGTKEKKGVRIKSAGTPLLGSAKAPSKSKTVKATPPAKAVAPTASKAKGPAVVPLSPAKDGKKTHADHARDLFNAGAFSDLRDYKKRAKKGWEVLGFSSSEIEKILK